MQDRSTEQPQKSPSTHWISLRFTWCAGLGAARRLVWRIGPVAL